MPCVAVVLFFFLAPTDDSFGDILKDLFGGVASVASGGGGGVLKDLVDFLENRVSNEDIY